MSDYLHRTRLRWCSASGAGVAIHDGVHVELRSRPRVLLNTARLIEIDPTLAAVQAALEREDKQIRS